MRYVLVLSALLAASCGSTAAPPTTEVAAPVPSTLATEQTTPAAPATTTPVAVTSEPDPTTTTEPETTRAECEPFVADQIARIQAVINEAAPLSLSELADLPNAPMVTPGWGPEPQLVEGTYLSTEELSAEELAEIETQMELWESCLIEVFLTPYRHADRLHLKSAAGAIAWSEDFTISTFIPFDFQYSPEAEAEVMAAFGEPPTPSTPVLGSPANLSCSDLEDLALTGAQSLIDTYTFTSWEFDDYVEAWIEEVDQAGADANCGELLFTRTVASNGHLLEAGDMFQVPSRAAMLSFAWEISWETFRG